MILHVVGNTRFEQAPERDVEFEDFFLDRIRETNVDAVHEFEDDSVTKLTLQAASAADASFELAAQQVSRRFHEQHVGASSDGAFFVFQLSCDDPDVHFYSLIKYDFREALEQQTIDDETHLRRIVNALISDRKAVQKSAIIKVQNGTAIDLVAARDRTKVPPDVSDYFATFLDVKRSRSNVELTQAAVKTLRETLDRCSDALPDNNVPLAFRRAQAVLRDHQMVTVDSILAAIFAAADHPEDEIVRRRLETAASRRMKAHKLDGVEFQASRRILRAPPMRRIKTVEGVMLQYPDDLENPVVNRRDDANGTVFTIRTQGVKEDRIVDSNPR
jgi:hypothetical protein